MKRTLFSLLVMVAISTSASAQAGWGSSDSWGAPKKTTKKKTTTSSGQAAGENRATGNEKLPQNDGRTVSPYPSGPAKPDANPGNTASTPPDNSFVPGTTSSSTQGGNDRQGMSAAPGTPVMLQSGRNVMANDAAATRERRLNRMNKLNRPAAVPTQVEGGAQLTGSQSTGAGAGATGAGAATGTTGAAGAEMRPVAPGKSADGMSIAPKAASADKSAPVKVKTKKKEAAAPAGW